MTPAETLALARQALEQSLDDYWRSEGLALENLVTEHWVSRSSVKSQPLRAARP